MDIKDMSIEERQDLARQGNESDLDILVKDDDWRVRWVVAEQNRDKDLDMLVHDESWGVREIVAEHGRDKDLDILVKDGDWEVREAVAKHGRPQDLNILVNDGDKEVRAEVARRGRPQDLDILVHDEDFFVRDIVARFNRPQDRYFLTRSDINIRVKEYFKQNLLQYEVLLVSPASNHPDDSYLYSVVAMNTATGKYAAWTSWNDDRNDLNYGHYDLDSLNDALLVITENFYDIQAPSVAQKLENRVDELKEEVEEPSGSLPRLKAINIKWDIDYFDNEDGEEIVLPKELKIPCGMKDEEEISDWLSDTVGFCHDGFEIIEDSELSKAYGEER